MKLTAMILAHKNPAQLRRLVKVLKEEGFEVCIHIDKKSKDLRPDMFENAISIHSVDWGGYSTIKATTALFKHSLKTKADYYFLISAQDYLLQRREEIIKQIQPGKQYVQWWVMPAMHWGPEGGMDRLNIYYFQGLPDRYNFRLQRLQRKYKWYRTLPGNIQFYGGSQWLTVDHEALRFLVKQTESYQRIYHHSLLADESIFQTILLNSSFKSQVVNDNLRLIEFTEWTAEDFPRPKVWTAANFDYLVTSQKVFARKFEDDEQVLDMLDQHRTAFKKITQD